MHQTHHVLMHPRCIVRVLTLEIRLILRVARQPCIKMHRFASLFEFFQSALPDATLRLWAYHHMLCTAETVAQVTHQNAPKRTTFSIFRPASLAAPPGHFAAFTALAINLSPAGPELVEGPRQTLHTVGGQYTRYQTVTKRKSQPIILAFSGFFAS